MLLEKFVRALFFGSLALLAAALWFSEALPKVEAIDEALLSEPEQRAVMSPAFTTEVGGVEYSVQPRFAYDLYGVVVSRHDSAAWWDYIHKEWNDNLNVVDLCVVWGENVRQDAYRAMSYTHDQWTCWYSTGSSEVFAAFDSSAISNNHMITDNPGVAAALRSARVGDQVHVQGYLADYTIYKHGASPFQRVSSTVRNDTGNGACEVVYVEEFSILKAGGGAWRAMRWIAGGLLALSILAWFLLPARVYR